MLAGTDALARTASDVAVAGLISTADGDNEHLQLDGFTMNSEEPGFSVGSTKFVKKEKKKTDGEYVTFSERETTIVKAPDIDNKLLTNNVKGSLHFNDVAAASDTLPSQNKENKQLDRRQNIEITPLNLSDEIEISNNCISKFGNNDGTIAVGITDGGRIVTGNDPTLAVGIMDAGLIVAGTDTAEETQVSSAAIQLVKQVIVFSFLRLFTLRTVDLLMKSCF